MKSVFKKMGLFLMSAIMMAVIFTGCSGSGMNGTYLSDTEDKYKIVIDGDNVKWYEGSMTFEGTVAVDGDDPRAAESFPTMYFTLKKPMTALK